MKKFVSLIIFLLLLLHTDVVFATEMTDATSYLKYLVETYPERVANTQENQNAGDWIFQNLLDMGVSVTREPVIDSMETTDFHYIANFVGGGEKTILVCGYYDTSPETAPVNEGSSSVAVLLEVVKQLKGIPCENTIKICFLNHSKTGEGTKNFLKSQKCDAVIFVDNCLAGDEVFAYSVDSEQEDFYNSFLSECRRSGCSIYEIPPFLEGTDAYQEATSNLSENATISIFLESSRWCNSERKGGNDQTNCSRWFQSERPEFSETGGKITQTEYDTIDLFTVLGDAVPGQLNRIVTLLNNVLPNLEWSEEDFLETAETNEATEEKVSKAAESKATEEKSSGVAEETKKEEEDTEKLESNEATKEIVKDSKKKNYLMEAIKIVIPIFLFLFLIVGGILFIRNNKEKMIKWKKKNKSGDKKIKK